MKSLKKTEISALLRIVLMILSAIALLGLSLRPIVSRDALKLHMAFSDLWKDEGFLFFNRYNAVIELGMMNLNYLYMLLLKFFGWEQLPKLLHTSFLIMTAVLFYFFIKKYYNKNYALWAYFLILTIPIHVRLSSEVYTDLGVLFFSTVCIVFYIKSFKEGFKPEYLYISAIFCGLAAGTKYNAFIFSLIMVLLIFKRISVDLGNRKAIKYAFVYSAIIIVMISPWLIRNFIGSGNPFYPLFTGIFGSNFEYPESLLFDPSDAKEIYLRIQSGESFMQILLIPLRFFFSGKDHDFLRFDGVLNPFIIFLVPFAFYRAKKGIGRSLNIDMLIIFLFILLFNSYYNIQRIRYSLPFMAPLIILITAGYFNLLELAKNNKIKYLLGIIISAPIFVFNILYAFQFVKNTELINYISGGIDKEQYLENHVPMYRIYNYINDNTSEDSVIYDVLCGNRYYYVKKKYVCSPSNLNWWFFNITYSNAKNEDYLKFLSDLPNTDNLRADYLLIKPDMYINSFWNIFYDHEDSLNTANIEKLGGFREFLNNQTPVAQEQDTYLFKINY